MKKLFVVLLLASLFSAEIFAAGKGDASGVGNGSGTNKLGGIIGVPIGLSFSHNFTRVDQIDLTVAIFPGIVGGYYGRYIAGDIALGYLRTIFEPGMCPLEIGAGASFTAGLFSGFHPYMTVYFDIRWEFFFPSAPKFNLFLDFSPGVGFHLGSPFYAYYAPRGGIGLRAVL